MIEGNNLQSKSQMPCSLATESASREDEPVPQTSECGYGTAFVNAASTSRSYTDKAYISCCSGTFKRPRLSAVRDFPDGRCPVTFVRDFPEGRCPKFRKNGDSEAITVILNDCLPPDETVLRGEVLPTDAVIAINDHLESNAIDYHDSFINKEHSTFSNEGCFGHGESIMSLREPGVLVSNATVNISCTDMESRTPLVKNRDIDLSQRDASSCQPLCCSISFSLIADQAAGEAEDILSKPSLNIIDTQEQSLNQHICFGSPKKQKHRDIQPLPKKKRLKILEQATEAAQNSLSRVSVSNAERIEPAPLWSLRKHKLGSPLQRLKAPESLNKTGPSSSFQWSFSKGLPDANRGSWSLNNGTSPRTFVKRILQEFEYIRKTLAKGPKTSKRPDIEAANILRDRGVVETGGLRIVGEVPGVEVGDEFHFRVELVIIGLHKQNQGGIDFIHGCRRSNGLPLATSIVVSGGYEDDDDSGDTLIYTGQGGNNYNGDKRQAKDQELVRGNLALKNSLDEHSPVRVIRGSLDPNNQMHKVYTYDGLYDVVDYWFRPGAAGYQVIQFKLVRKSGQAELGSSIVRFVGLLRNKTFTRPHLLLEDISGGQESLPVCVVNELDTDSVPSLFTYMSKMMYPSWYKPEPPKGCDCIGDCVDESKCLCAKKNGGEFPYNPAGYLIRDKHVVYECGSSCACLNSCQNRVSQRGLRYHLEVFKTKKRGWGVRSLDSIWSGGFICEYTGELLSDAEAEQRTGSDEYLFDLGSSCNNTSCSPERSEASTVEYTIDAKSFGGVARFINHSCSPDLFTQNVLFDSDDLRFLHVMLFAMENIPPMRELSYDYNYAVGHIQDANGNVKIKECYCGAEDCTHRLY